MSKLFYIFIFISKLSFALSDVYLVEGKVQSDLENALSRIIPREEFLVQVNAEIQVRSERKLVEGETIVTQMERVEESPVRPMPGFVPDIREEQPKDKPTQSRQVYRTVDTSELAALKVYVKFDDALKPVTVTQAKNAVQEYLRGSYASKAARKIRGSFTDGKDAGRVREAQRKSPALNYGTNMAICPLDRSCSSVCYRDDVIHSKRQSKKWKRRYKPQKHTTLFTPQ